MGSDESHFNVSVGGDGQVTRQCPQTKTFFEEKGEPKRYRTEVLPLTSLTPYRLAKPAHKLTESRLELVIISVTMRNSTQRAREESASTEMEPPWRISTA